jgi:hypothetical protein
LHDEAGKTNAKYFGFDGARARFLYWFKNFQSSNYLEVERKYKISAKTKLDSTAPLSQAATGTGFGEAVWSVFQTNLLSPFEKMRVRRIDVQSFIWVVGNYTEGREHPRS